MAAQIDTRAYGAARLYVERQMGRSRPMGDCDRDGRWYPVIIERRPCCDKVRPPSRRWPWSIYRHCLSASHIAALYDADHKTVMRLAKRMKQRYDGLKAVQKRLAVERCLATINRSEDGGIVGWKWLLKTDDGLYYSPIKKNVWYGGELYACEDYRRSGEGGIYFYTSYRAACADFLNGGGRWLLKICAHGRIEISLSREHIAMCEYAHIVSDNT